MYQNRSLSKSLLIVCIGLLQFFVAFYPYGIRHNFFVELLFFAIGIFSVFEIFNSKIIYLGLHQIFFFFTYIFFSIAPLIQYKYNLVFNVNIKILDQAYIHAGLFVLASIIFYQYAYTFFVRRNFMWFDHTTVKIVNISNRFLVGLSFGSLFICLVLFSFHYNYFIYRSFGVDVKEIVKFGAVGYGILLIVKYIPFVVFLKAIHQKSNISYLVILGILMLLALFPTSLSRSLIAILYFPLLILLFPKLMFRDNFMILLFVSILLVFPVLNNFRYQWIDFSHWNYELFESAHFDAFQNLLFLIRENLITNGKQLLASILFFKHHFDFIGDLSGTGCLLATKMGYEYTNVAMPFLGEGFANFGYVGVLSFLGILAFFNAKIDQWTYNEPSFYKFYLKFILIGWQFYLLRGDMMSAFKILTGLVLSFMLVHILSKTMFTSEE